MCALNGSLQGSDDDKDRVHEVWPMERFTSLDDTGVDPFEEIPEDEVSLEGVPELKIDPDNSDEDEGVVID